MTVDSSVTIASVSVAVVTSVVRIPVVSKESGLRIGAPLPQEMPVAEAVTVAVVRETVTVVAMVTVVAVMTVAWFGEDNTRQGEEEDLMNAGNISIDRAKI